MIRKTKIWVGVILLFLFIFLGFRNELVETKVLLNSNSERDKYDLKTVTYVFWYNTEISKSVSQGYKIKCNSFLWCEATLIDNSKFPYTVWKNIKNGNENLLYLCSNNNP